MLAVRRFGNSRWAALAVLVAAVQAASLAPADAVGSADQETAQAVARLLNLSEREAAGSVRILRSPLPPDVRIHVVSVQSAPGQGGMLVRLACDQSSQCLPFYAILQGTKLSPKPQPGPAAPITQARPPKPPLRRGDRVEVVEELSGMNLRTRGVCLQSGSVGDRIRVRNLATHRVLRAVIAAPDLVKVER